MTESNDELERRVRASLARSSPNPSRRARGSQDQAKRPKTPPATKIVANRHVKMLTDASAAHLKDVSDTLHEILTDGVSSAENFDSLVGALSSSQDAFKMFSLAATSIVDDLKRERDELRAELGNENVKRAYRKSAAATVAAGHVTVKFASDGAVHADVRDSQRTYRVTRKKGEAWECDCGLDADCSHRRAVQLVTRKCDPFPGSLPTDAAGLAGSGGITITSYDQANMGLAEVIHGSKTHVVARQGYGGYSCTCGALNASCLHGDAVRFLTSRAQ